MWILFAFASAFFAGVTAILAKLGIEGTDSYLVTALRTVVVVLFAWLMVFVTGGWNAVGEITAKTFTFLILSGFATGASWICYFKALQIGDVDKVVPIDKSSTVLTMLLAFFFLGEGLTILKVVSILLISAGTYLMIEKRGDSAEKKEGRGWLFYAVLSAVFASLTAILGKVGISGIESNLGTAIRTLVVLAMAWILVFGLKKQSQIREIPKKSWIFILLSGLTTGLSWLCYYRALQQGPASVVVPIDKLSILVTVLFARVVFRERLSKKGMGGLAAVVCGTLLLLERV